MKKSILFFNLWILIHFFPVFAQNNPEHIILTWKNDPESSQAITWRSEKPLDHPIVELYKSSSSPIESSVKIPFSLDSSKVSLADQGTWYYYSANFESLNAGITYSYRVGDLNSEMSPWMDFKTPKEKGGLRFLYLGDIQNEISNWGTRTIRAAYQHSPHSAFMLFAGDCVNDGHQNSQWEEWFDALGFIPTQMPIVPVTGNHEYDELPGSDEESLSAFWQSQFELPLNGPKGLEESVYYYDIQSTRIIILNSLMALQSEEDLSYQTEWLEKVLQENPQEWTIISYHHPLFSSRDGNHGQYPELRDAWQPKFEKYGVDLVLQGHDHMYGRSSKLSKTLEIPTGQAGPVYIVSVAGPKMYGIKKGERWMERAAVNTQLFQEISIENNKLEFRAFTVEGELYDSFDLIKNPKGFNFFKEHINSESTPENTFPNGTYSNK